MPSSRLPGHDMGECRERHTALRCHVRSECILRFFENAERRRGTETRLIQSSVHNGRNVNRVEGGADRSVPPTVGEPPP